MLASRHGEGLTDELPGTIQWISSSPPPRLNNAKPFMHRRPCARLDKSLKPLLSKQINRHTRFPSRCTMLQNLQKPCKTCRVSHIAVLSIRLYNSLTRGIPCGAVNLSISDPYDPKPRKDGKKLLLPAGLLAHQTPKSLLAESPPAQTHIPLRLHAK